ncbi:MAG: T9SS type A sorting domain-containing protein [Bacteroidales bacterium]|nr:T9SS type A sorting domain-containing protein [Bacteroidales bacterium]
MNSYGYLLQAGDENPLPTNNNLDGEIISGNKFIWNGTDETSMTHALFTGYNIDVVIRYNYLLNTPNGIQRKSNGETDNNGVIAYNILKNPKLGVAVKGINGIKIYNNTFYSDKTSDQTTRGLIDIYTNTDNDLNAPSKGTKVYNNIFYTRNRIFNINIHDLECLEGFESDYNVFWCEAGDPIFQIDGKTKTYAMWQAMGYDLHSVVINPNFIDMTEFIPATRLDFGKDMGPDLQTGLAVDAIWNKTSIKTTDQNGLWQAGARVYQADEEEEEEEEEEEQELPRNMTLIYPNPTYGTFYLLLTDPARMYQTMKILDSNGKIVLSRLVEYGRTEIPVPENFASGMYIITMEGDNLDRYIRRLIIIN